MNHPGSQPLSVYMSLLINGLFAQSLRLPRSSGRWYWGGYFFRMPLRGVGPTLSPRRRLYEPEAGL